MGDAEKADNLPVTESRPEAFDKEAVFNELSALLDKGCFDLRGRIKKVKRMDPAVKKEMLDYADEAKGMLTNFKRDGFSRELHAEAVDCFNILQEMAEKHLPNFEQDLAEYNSARVPVELPKPKLVVDNVSGEKPALESAIEAPAAEVAGEVRQIKIIEDEKYQGKSTLFARQARINSDVRQAGEVDPTKLEKVEKTQGGGDGKEPPSGEKIEELKQQLEAAYKELYGFLNEKKEAPRELYATIKRLENELRDLVRVRSEIADLAEEFKQKYKKDERKAGNKKEEGGAKDKKELGPKVGRRSAGFIQSAPMGSAEKNPITPEENKELPPAVREILFGAIDEFRQQLEKEAAAMAGWEKYKPEQQQTLLNIEAESFLRNLVSEKLVPKGLVKAEDVDFLVAELLKEKIEVSAASEKEEEAKLSARAVEENLKKPENDPEVEAELKEAVEAYKRLSQWSKDHEASFIFDEEHEKDAAAFYKKFNTRLGLKNAMERRKDNQNLLPPKIAEENAGYLFIYRLKNDLFAVVPSVGLRYDGYMGYIGGIDDVFENSNFAAANERMDNLRIGDPKKYDIELIRPAILEKKPDGTFNVVEKGELKLKEIN